MAIERANITSVGKPWGRRDLRPWSEISSDAEAIGELWFDRADAGAPDTALLLKLLFTDQPLSIQVHPDDAFARSIGLANGKTEAWYILSASPDARIAVGLAHLMTAGQLRTAIEDGSISHLVKWRTVQKDDVVFVPAGTIHAVGAGLVLAEIQQRSDATFRLFDFGRNRQLDTINAVAATIAGIFTCQAGAHRLTDARVLLVASPYFVLERIDLGAGTRWQIDVDAETWLLVVAGEASVGRLGVSVGEAIFMEADHADIDVGPSGLTFLLAYVAADRSPILVQAFEEHEVRPHILAVPQAIDRGGAPSNRSVSLLEAWA